MADIFLSALLHTAERCELFCWALGWTQHSAWRDRSGKPLRPVLAEQSPRPESPTGNTAQYSGAAAETGPPRAATLHQILLSHSLSSEALQQNRQAITASGAGRGGGPPPGLQSAVDARWRYCARFYGPLFVSFS